MQKYVGGSRLDLQVGNGAQRLLRVLATVLMALALFVAVVSAAAAIFFHVWRPLGTAGTHGMLPEDFASMIATALTGVVAAVSLVVALLASLARLAHPLGRAAAIVLGTPLLFALQSTVLGAALLGLAIAAQLFDDQARRAAAGNVRASGRVALARAWFASPLRGAATLIGLALLVESLGSAVFAPYLRSRSHERYLNTERHLAESQKAVTAKLEACEKTDELEVFCEGVRVLGLSKNGRWLATVGNRGLVLWNVSTRRLRWRSPASSLDQASQQLLVSDDGTRVVAVSEKQVLVLGEGGSKPALSPCAAAKSGEGRVLAPPLVGSAALSPDGTELTVAASNTCVYDLATSSPRITLCTTCDAKAIAYSSDGRAVWLTNASSLRRFELPSGTLSLLVDLRAETQPPSTIALPDSFELIGASADGNRVYTIGKQTKSEQYGVWRWDANAALPGGKTGAPSASPLSSLPLVFYGPAQNRSAWFGDQVALGSTLVDGVRAFDLATGSVSYRFPEQDRLRLVAASQDGSVVFAASDSSDRATRRPSVVRKP